MKTEKDENGLLPCPFCGDEAQLMKHPLGDDRGPADYTAECMTAKCWATQGPSSGKNDAVRLWNTRVSPPQPEKAWLGDPEIKAQMSELGIKEQRISHDLGDDVSFDIDYYDLNKLFSTVAKEARISVPQPDLEAAIEEIKSKTFIHSRPTGRGLGGSVQESFSAVDTRHVLAVLRKHFSPALPPTHSGENDD